MRYYVKSKMQKKGEMGQTAHLLQKIQSGKDPIVVEKLSAKENSPGRETLSIKVERLLLLLLVFRLLLAPALAWIKSACKVNFKTDDSSSNKFSGILVPLVVVFQAHRL